MKWNNLNHTPTKGKTVEVRDVFGVVAEAQPTYYTYKTIDNKIIQCDLFWDGGWMIKRSDLSKPKISKVTHWREF